MAKTNTALVTSIKDKAEYLEAYLTERSEMFDEICKGLFNTRRLIHLAMSVGRRNPDLIHCDPASWVVALFDSIFFGIEPNPQLGHAYLIPYKNKKRKTVDCQFMIGYKGLILLATAPGSVALDIQPTVVYEGDKFELHYERTWEGKAPYTHSPSRPREGKMTDIYTEAILANGARKFLWLPKTGDNSIEYYRAKSRAANSGPWMTAYNAMAMKTAIRRQCDHLAIRPGTKLGLSIKAEQTYEEGETMHAFTFDEKSGKVEKELAEEAIDTTGQEQAELFTR